MRCCWCGCPLVWGEDYRPNPNHRVATLEHVITKHQGGKDVDGNFRLACHDCNTHRDQGWHPQEVKYYKQCPPHSLSETQQAPCTQKLLAPSRSPATRRIKGTAENR